MTDLVTLKDVKIPYPTEGVVRTAQLDDTVAPSDSVELAVNMNFDRVGAIKTRLGIEEYATQLAGQVDNFGTLRNSIIPDGYDYIYEIRGKEEFSSTATHMTIGKVDDTHVIIFWSGTDNKGYAQVFETSQQTGGLTAIGDPLEFDSSTATDNVCIQVSSLQFLNVWTGPNGDGFAQAFNIDSSTFEVTTAGSSLEFDTANGADFALAQVDSTHFICFYRSTNGDGIATIFQVSGGTVTEPGSPLTFEAGLASFNACASLGDGTHFINTWDTGGSISAQVFTVNTGTWAITANGTALTYASSSGSTTPLVAIGDGQHFASFYETSGPSVGNVRVLSVNLSTFAVTSVSGPTSFYTGNVSQIAAVSMGTQEDFVVSWEGADDVLYTRIVNIAPTTFDVTFPANATSFGEADQNNTLASVTMSSYRVMTIWRDVSVTPNTGVGSMFKLQGAGVVDSNLLYAQVEDEILSWDGSAWTVRRSGLAEVSKARFSEYLNNIWMVNGNQQIGGDPVATSDGGAFSTDIVPIGFPPGDFIHAGFEGRVWVVNKTLGIVYYTDIVQFTQPDVYTLSYDPSVNFIQDINAQSNQSFTALFRVPRALLLFTQDHIYRIYGATSVDSYPAYNVGTFSQESIIETKTGIFFHHSSGFYYFDYGSQPIEISRRIIDFVKAIPRSMYENIVGVYDNFDSVSWYVGPITVDGVYFSNCVLRYTISTQVWTVYNYSGNTITAAISFDDGANLNHIAGTSTGKVGALDKGYTDFGSPFDYEFVDRWRSYTDLYCKQKSISGVNVYSENAAGANLSYQIQKSTPNTWEFVGGITEENNSLFPNSNTKDFDVMRWRIAGTTSGVPVVIHGIEITTITIKGYNRN